jgi:hypothetical protein
MGWVPLERSELCPLGGKSGAVGRADAQVGTKAPAPCALALASDFR